MLEFFILFLIGETLWRLVIQIVNLQKLQPRCLEAEGLSGVETLRVADYQTALGNWQLFGLLYQRSLLIGLLLSGFFVWFDDQLARLQLPLAVHGILYLMLLELGGFLLSFPLYIYRKLIIEERFGFNKESLQMVIKDKIISGTFGLLLLGPLVFLLLWLMATTTLWWIYGFFGLIIFQIFLFWVYPLVIAPLYNSFTPLEDGALKERLERLLRQCNFPCKGLYVMDGSRRSLHSNAYFTGFGKSRRIVLYDTLVQQLNEDQLAAVLAHEIGHYRRYHLLLNLLASIIGIVSLFILGAWGLQQDWLFRGFGFAAAKPYLLILLAAWLLPIQQYLIQPFMLWMSRHHEYQADAFSAELLGNSSFLEQALQVLARKNFSHPNPHVLYVAFNYSHPPLQKRLLALQKFNAGHRADLTEPC